MKYSMEMQAQHHLGPVFVSLLWNEHVTDMLCEGGYIPTLPGIAMICYVGWWY